MKKRVVSGLVILVFITFARFASAAIIDSGELTTGAIWELNDAGVLTISGEASIDRHIATEQYPWAKRNLESKINKVIVEVGVKGIGDNAFDNCINLKEIILPNTITYISSSAFNGCNSLNSIDLPDSLVDFAGIHDCPSLKSITIPTKVTEIYGGFIGCDSLTEIKASSGHKSLKSINGILFSADGTELVAYPIGRSGEYTIPEGVTSLGDIAFFGAKKITKINMPETLETIGWMSFRNCSLVDVTIPKNVNDVGDAFCDCSNLRKIEVEYGSKYYKSIDGILYNADITEIIRYPQGKKADSYYMPNTVKKFNDVQPLNNSNIKRVSISKSIEIFDNSDANKMDFHGCKNLTTIFIPKSISVINNESFESNIKDVYYEGSKDEWNNVKILVPPYRKSNFEDAVVHYNSTGLPNEESLSFKVEGNAVTNTADIGGDAEVIVAEYNKGVLKNIRHSVESFLGHERKRINANGEYKIFVWDSLEGMRPLTK